MAKEYSFQRLLSKLMYSWLVSRGNWDTLIVRQISDRIFSRMLSCHRPFCRARCASDNSIPSRDPNTSGSPLCTGAMAVPSFTLRTALSATPERWKVLVSWFHCKYWHAFHKLFCIVCVNYVWRLWRKKKSLWTWFCFRYVFQFHRLTLDPIREVILNDWKLVVSTSRLFFHVQNFVICCDQVSERCRKYNPVHALLRFYSTPGSCCFFVFSQTSQLGSFGWRVNMLWFPLGGDRWYLSYSRCLLPEYLPPASVTTEGSLSSVGFYSTTCLGSLPAFGVEEDA